MDLGRFYSLLGVLTDSNGDDLPDGLGVTMVLGAEATAEEGYGATVLAARLGLEVMGLHLPLVVEEDPLVTAAGHWLVVGIHNRIYQELLAAHPQLWTGVALSEGLIQAFPEREGRSVILVAGRSPGAQLAAAHYLATLLDPLSTHEEQLVFNSRLGAAVSDASPGRRWVIRADPPAPVPRGGEAPQPGCLSRLWTWLQPQGEEPGEAGGLMVLPRKGTTRDYVQAANWAARWGLEQAVLDFPCAVFDDQWSPELSGARPLILVGGENRLVQQLMHQGKWQRPTSEAGLALIQPAFGQTPALILWGEAAQLPPSTYPGGPTPWQAATQAVQAWLEPGGEAGLALACRRALEQLEPPAEGDRVRLEAQLPGPAGGIEPVLARWGEQLWGTAPEVHSTHLQPEVVLSASQALPWEVEEAHQCFAAILGAASRLPRPLSLEFRLSESEAVRSRWAHRWRQELAARGCPAEVTVLSAHKQGFSWLKEAVLPRLPRGVAEIVIEFSPFGPQDGPWIDVPVLWLEQGKPEGERRLLDLPGVMRAMAADDDKWLGLPIRHLCELYPIDEVLASSLGLDVEQIRFRQAKELTASYRVTAADAAGRQLFTEEFTSHYQELPYLAAFPHWGKVHVESAGCQVKAGGQLWMNQRISTDLLRAWEFYQRFLVQLKEYLLREFPGKLTPDHQPFFHQLSFSCWLSELDEELGVGEELLSTLESLHEDVYFVTLDFFNALGQLQGDWRLEAPGQIIPRIHAAPGGGRVEVTLEGLPQAGQLVLTRGSPPDSKQVVRLGAPPPLTVSLEAATRDATGAWAYHFRLEGEIIPQGLTALGECPCPVSPGGAPTRVLLHTPEGELEWRLTAAPLPAASQDAAPVPLETIIDGETCYQLLLAWKDAPEVGWWRAGRSLQGRDIWAISLSLPLASPWRSQVKSALFKPTYHVNNRHHANEVSATNAALWLVEDCLGEVQAQRWLKRLNLCILPMENVDGAALHYALQQEHPRWMLHAARYNAVGMEFAREYHRPDTPITEARALGANWEAWQPDIMVDCHERPSHEWRQLFAGYTPVSWPYLWILPSFFTGIMHYVDAPQWPEHRRVAQQLREAVVSAMEADAEIRERNRVWQRRYQKYAAAYLPEKFPFSIYNGVQFHCHGVTPGPTAASFAGRHPQVTAVNWVTEVAAETPQGDFLRLCARTHRLANRAVLERMANAVYCIERYRQRGPGGWVRVGLRRPRPLRWD